MAVMGLKFAAKPESIESIKRAADALGALNRAVGEATAKMEELKAAVEAISIEIEVVKEREKESESC